MEKPPLNMPQWDPPRYSFECNGFLYGFIAVQLNKEGYWRLYSWNKNGFVQNYLIKSCSQEMLLHPEGWASGGGSCFPQLQHSTLTYKTKSQSSTVSLSQGSAASLSVFMSACNRKTNKQKPSYVEFLLLQHWSKFTLFLSKCTVKVLCLDMLSLLTWFMFCLQGSPLS